MTTLSAARTRAITAFREYRRLGAERFPRPEMIEAETKQETHNA